LRGLAALFVVAHHALSPFGVEKDWVPHAQLAVDFFFALSGFVVAAAYERRLRGSMTVRGFMLRRWIRLYPMALAGLVFGGLVWLVRRAVGAAAGESSVLASFLINLMLLPDLRPGGPASAWPLNVALWSLSVEVLLSLGFAVLWARSGSRALLAWLVAAAVALAVMALTLGGVAGGHEAAQTWIGPVRGVFPFLAGVLLWRWQAASSVHWTVHPVWPVAGLLLMFLLPAGVAEGWVEAVMALVLVPALVALGARVAPLRRLSGANAWLGRLSYPLYALHYPVIQLGSGLARKLHLEPGPRLAAWVLLEVVLASALALLMCRWFDEPVRRWLSMRLQPGPAAPMSVRTA
jgi:peptidoglycan/LPS O-acetylase OafA/YrhL